MKLLLVLNRAFIAIDACVKGIVKTKKTKENKTILIVFQQVFGDSVILQNSLQEYVKLFPQNEGYEIRFLVRPSVLSFMKKTMELPEEILLEEVDFKRFLEDYRYYKQVVKRYRHTASTLIVPGTSLSAEIFSSASDASRKIGLVRCYDVKSPFAMAIFNQIAYTEKVRPEKDEMMLQRHRRLIHYLGGESYNAKLPNVLEKSNIVNEERYCVMCPGASVMEKCWPTERFVEIADYIIENYNMNIHLCGGADEIKFEEIILEATNYKDKVISHIGKTSFSDWSAIVQHSAFVIGNDSATMHLAAASRRNAICIAGVYDKYMFFPYKVDELEDGDILPITLIKDMPCEWCRTIGYEAGFGNSECKNRIDNSMCASCIDAITVQDVKKQIDILMNA